MEITENTMLADSVEVAEYKAQYDYQVKLLLSDKQVLARIMKHTMDEYSGMQYEEIMECIEGKPEVGTTPVEPGRKAEYAQIPRIIGANTEDAVVNEGKVNFDVRFKATLPEGEPAEVIINVEGQKTGKPGYDLVTRAIFYCARLLSAQLGTEFTNKKNDPKKYDGIRKVYSVWICVEPLAENKDSIVKYSIKPDIAYAMQGKSKDYNFQRYDIMTAIMINLGVHTVNSHNRLIAALSTLLSDELAPDNKKDILQDKYGFSMTSQAKGGVSQMCNLSDLIYEKGVAFGEARGEKRGEARGEKRGEARGEKRGRWDGKMELLKDLVQEGTYTIAQAAAKAGLSEAAFKAKAML